MPRLEPQRERRVRLDEALVHSPDRVRDKSQSFALLAFERKRKRLLRLFALVAIL